MIVFKTIVFAFWLTASLAQAQTTVPPGPLPPPVQVAVNAALHVDTCTSDGSVELCGIQGVLFPNNQVITLNPRGPNEFIGYYSEVNGISGVRYIGVITANLFKISNGTGTGPLETTYAFTVEIIGENGAEARMELSVSDPIQLVYATLHGNKKVVGNTTYLPSFSIGPAIPNPVDPSPGNRLQWNVTQGSLR